jgi:hypothetical protein
MDGLLPLDAAVARMITITDYSVIRPEIPMNAAGFSGTVATGWAVASPNSMQYRFADGGLSVVMLVHCGVDVLRGTKMNTVASVNARLCFSGPMIRLFRDLNSLPMFLPPRVYIEMYTLRC